MYDFSDVEILDEIDAFDPTADDEAAALLSIISPFDI